jgi:hypothetical protein
MSDFFNVTIGVRQEEPLISLVFVNDITEKLDFNALTEKDFELL